MIEAVDHKESMRIDARLEFSCAVMMSRKVLELVV